MLQQNSEIRCSYGITSRHVSESRGYVGTEPCELDILLATTGSRFHSIILSTAGEATKRACSRSNTLPRFDRQTQFSFGVARRLETNTRSPGSN